MGSSTSHPAGLAGQANLAGSEITRPLALLIVNVHRAGLIADRVRGTENTRGGIVLRFCSNRPDATLQPLAATPAMSTVSVPLLSGGAYMTNLVCLSFNINSVPRLPFSWLRMRRATASCGHAPISM